MEKLYRLIKGYGDEGREGKRLVDGISEEMVENGGRWDMVLGVVRRLGESGWIGWDNEGSEGNIVCRVGEV